MTAEEQVLQLSERMQLLLATRSFLSCGWFDVSIPPSSHHPALCQRLGSLFPLDCVSAVCKETLSCTDHSPAVSVWHKLYFFNIFWNHKWTTSQHVAFQLSALILGAKDESKHLDTTCHIWFTTDTHASPSVRSVFVTQQNSGHRVMDSWEN